MEKNKQRPLALVTGASDGIGYELSKVLARNGYDLFVCAEDGGIAEAAQAFEQLGGAVERMQVDLTRPEDVERFWARAESLGRPVDVACLNAGVGVGGPFLETELQAELNLIALNVTSQVHLAKRVLQHMSKRDEGKVLVTASVVSTMPGPFEAVYAASKAFLLSFSEALRNELKDTRITVTALMPGATETNFFHRAGMDDTKVGQAEKDDPAHVAQQGFDALMAGKDKVVAGSLKNKVQVAGAKVLPDQVKANIHRGMAEPGSGSK